MIATERRPIDRAQPADRSSTSKSESRARWNRLGWAAVAAGALLRLTFLDIHPPQAHIYSDMAGYLGRAQALASGAHLFPYDAFYPPGTHVLLALPLSLFGVHHSGLVAAGWLGGCCRP